MEKVTWYRGYEVKIFTDAKSKQIVYDVFRNRQYVLAGFSYTNETEVLDRLKVKIQELLSQL